MGPGCCQEFPTFQMVEAEKSSSGEQPHQHDWQQATDAQCQQYYLETAVTAKTKACHFTSSALLILTKRAAWA
jgi:hypothetical protein